MAVPATRRRIHDPMRVVLLLVSGGPIIMAYGNCSIADVLSCVIIDIQKLCYHQCELLLAYRNCVISNILRVVLLITKLEQRYLQHVGVVPLVAYRSCHLQCMGVAFLLLPKHVVIGMLELSHFVCVGVALLLVFGSCVILVYRNCVVPCCKDTQ